MQSRAKISPWDGRPVSALNIHTLVRGRFIMRDRELRGARGHGCSVHAVQATPPPRLSNRDKTTAAVLAKATGRA